MSVTPNGIISFGGTALAQTQYPGLPIQGAFDDFQRVQLSYGYLDLLLLSGVGLGMLLWMLEDEREDRLANWERIAASQRLEAIGRLAAGVAHDFNNLLTAIEGNADLALLDLDQHHGARPFLNEIRGATQRATSVTRQLLAVGRKNPVEASVLDLNASHIHSNGHDTASCTTR